MGEETTMLEKLSADVCVPRDAREALLIGRAWTVRDGGPSVIAVRGQEAVDLTRVYPTVSQLLNVAKPAELRQAIKQAPRGRPGGPCREQCRGTPRSLEAVAAGPL